MAGRVLNPGVDQSKWNTLSRGVRKASNTLRILKKRGGRVADAQTRYNAAVQKRNDAIAACVERDGAKTRASIEAATRDVKEHVTSQLDDVKKSLGVGDGATSSQLVAQRYLLAERLKLARGKEKLEAAEAKRQKTEAKSQKMEAKSQKMEAKKQKMEAKRQEMEAKTQAAGGKRNAELDETIAATSAKVQKKSATVDTPPDIGVDVRECFATEAEAENIKEVLVRLYNYRASVLKRAPKAEFYRGEHLISYFWGQHRSNDSHALRFPGWMEALAARIDRSINHAIVIKYHDGVVTHAPWHSDKSEDTGRKSGCMKRGTSFYVVSVGDPRVFEIGDGDKTFWKQALPHRSLVEITSAVNAAYKHRVPQDTAWKGVRWSLIFRTIV